MESWEAQREGLHETLVYVCFVKIVFALSQSLGKRLPANVSATLPEWHVTDVHSELVYKRLVQCSCLGIV